MSCLLAIDSGHPESACASFVGCVLRRVFSGNVDTVPDWAHYAYDRVVVEVPTLRGDATPNPESLILIGIAGPRLAERCSASAAPERLREVRPAEWKGSLPKAVCHLRMWQALSDTERALLGGDATAKAIANACNRGAKARWKKHANHHYSNRDLPKVGGIAGVSDGTLKITHDILDAVALGLWYLGRLNLAAVTKG
jgi:hypothetical protein